MGVTKLVPILLIALLVMVFAAGCGDSTTSRSIYPTPDSGRTQYTSSTFHYALTYPSQWRLAALKAQSLVRIYPVATAFVPDALATDVVCASNPKHLTPQAWWQVSQHTTRTESAQGSVKLGSGVNSYAATGHGQTSYTVYTVTTATTACQLLAYDIDVSINKFGIAIVNSFTWLKG